MAGFEASIHASGPMFDGRAQHEVVSFMTELKGVVADQASADVHAIANSAFKNPTPYYETQIHRFRRGINEVVNDRGIIYGPWLEGTGSRNKTTRFKGYHLWRLATRSAYYAVPRLARAVLARHLRGMQ